MSNRSLRRSHGFGRRSDPDDRNHGRLEYGCDAVERRVRPDVAEQAAVLVGAVLLVLQIERAPLAEDGQAEEYKHTKSAPVTELCPSVH